MTTLGSKDKTCIHPRLRNVKGGALRAECKKLRLNVKESCYLFINTMKNE